MTNRPHRNPNRTPTLTTLRRLGATLAAALLGAFGTLPATAAAEPGEAVQLWEPNGPVWDVKLRGSVAYLAGDFTHIAPHVGSFAALGRADARQLPGWPDVSGGVSALAPDEAGGWYIGGNFTAVNGEPRRRLAHILADGSLDRAWTPTPDGEVSAIKVTPDSVFIGGAFEQVNGAAHRHIAKLDRGGGQVGAFNGHIAGAAEHVSDLEVRSTAGGPILYVAGNFNQAGTSKGIQAQSNIAAFDVNDNVLATFAEGTNFQVNAIELIGGTLFAGGYFNRAGAELNRAGLAAFSAVDGVLLPWDARLSSETGSTAVLTLEEGVGALYVGGSFSRVNIGLPGAADRANAASFNLATATVTAWDPSFDSTVFDLALSGETIYASGFFRRVNGPAGRARNGVAEVRAGTGEATTWRADTNSTVGSVGASDETVAIAAFNPLSIGGEQRNSVAAIDLETGLPTEFNPNVAGEVFAIELTGDALWAGGSFKKVGPGIERGSLASFDLSSGAVSSFNQPVSDTVLDLAARGDTVYAGGHFTKVGAQAIPHLAGFRAVPGTAGQVIAPSARPNADVQSLAVRDATLYASGGFLTFGGQPRRHAAAIDLATDTLSPWDPNPSDRAMTLLSLPDRIVAGGRFESIGGAEGPTAAALLDPGSGSATRVAPITAGYAEALASTGDELIVGGTFETVGGQPREGLASLDPETLAVRPWRPRIGAGGVVFGLAASPSWVVAGGIFTGGDGPVRNAYLTAYRNATEAPPTSAGGGGGGAAQADRTPPRLSGLRLSRGSFRVGAPPRRGTRVTFRLDERARVNFQVLALRPGLRKGKRCMPRRGPRPAKGRACTTTVPRGSFVHAAGAGATQLPFAGRVRGRALPPGRYRLLALPTDAAGNSGAQSTVSFRVLPAAKPRAGAR